MSDNPRLTVTFPAEPPIECQYADVKADGMPPVMWSRLIIDFKEGGVVRAEGDGYLKFDGVYPVNIEAEIEDMTVTCPETGRRYKLTRTD